MKFLTRKGFLIECPQCGGTLTILAAIVYTCNLPSRGRLKRESPRRPRSYVEHESCSEPAAG